MKDGSTTEEQAEVSRQQLYEDYVKCFLQLCPEVGPCRDARLLQKAARYLLEEPEPGATFSVFPFYQAVRPHSDSLSTDCRKHLSAGSLSTDCRKHLSAVIRATELLETICVNLFLHPWKKEIKTLKTFTGPFVYCLLPVLSSSTIQSVLASIGYLLHTDTPQSEYRLDEDANTDRAMLLGFELLLARVECHHLLELLEKDQPGPQEFLEVLQRRVRPTKQEEPTEKKETPEMKEEAETKEEPLYVDTKLDVKPQPSSRRCHFISVDQSIVEMQMTYPDLAFRGRPLLPDKPQRANKSSKSRSKDVHTTSTNNNSDGREAAELPSRDVSKGPKAAAATSISSKNYGSKADEVFGDDGRGSVCNDRTSAPGQPVSSSISNTDGSRVDDELSGPQAISLHIPLTAGSKAEHSRKPGESQSTAEPPVCTVAENDGLGNPKLPTVSSVDEMQELRWLAERMGQLHVQETKEEVKRKAKNKERKEENTNKERRNKEGTAEDENLRKPVVEAGPALSKCTTSSWSDPAVMKEQKQPTSDCERTADCQSWRGGDSTGKLEGEETERSETGREEEQLAQSFVIVEDHKK